MARCAVASCALSSAAAGCGGSSPPSPPACLETLDTECAPLYEPTFEQVFTRTLAPTCGKSGVSCHASTGRQGGLVFEDADVAYKLLTDATRPRVAAGDPKCSELVRRIVATDRMVAMPPGRSLPPAEQCAVIQWVARGAQR